MRDGDIGDSSRERAQWRNYSRFKEIRDRDRDAERRRKWFKTWFWCFSAGGWARDRTWRSWRVGTSWNVSSVTPDLSFPNYCIQLENIYIWILLWWKKLKTGQDGAWIIAQIAQCGTLFRRGGRMSAHSSCSTVQPAEAAGAQSVQGPKDYMRLHFTSV